MKFLEIFLEALLGICVTILACCLWPLTLLALVIAVPVWLIERFKTKESN